MVSSSVNVAPARSGGMSRSIGGDRVSLAPLPHLKTMIPVPSVKIFTTKWTE